MRGTAAVAGTLIAGGAAHDKQREHVDQAPDVIDFEATSRRLQVTAVLLFVTLLQVMWVSALGYGVFVLMQ